MVHGCSSFTQTYGDMVNVHLMNFKSDIHLTLVLFCSSLSPERDTCRMLNCVHKVVTWSCVISEIFCKNNDSRPKINRNNEPKEAKALRAMSEPLLITVNTEILVMAALRLGKLTTLLID